MLMLPLKWNLFTPFIRSVSYIFQNWFVVLVLYDIVATQKLWPSLKTSLVHAPMYVQNNNNLSMLYFVLFLYFFYAGTRKSLYSSDEQYVLWIS